MKKAESEKEIVTERERERTSIARPVEHQAKKGGKEIEHFRTDVSYMNSNTHDNFI